MFNSNTNFTFTGEANPKAEKNIIANFKKSYFSKDTKDLKDVSVYVSSVPAGFEYDGGLLKPTSSTNEVIGRISFKSPNMFVMRKEKAIEAAKKFAAAAKGNTAIINYIKDYTSPTIIKGFEGFVVKTKTAQSNKNSDKSL
jgi:hypothetical protein